MPKGDNNKGKQWGQPFQPGVSRPAGPGRPAMPEELKRLAQAKGPAALEVALELMDDSDQPGQVRLAAAREVLDRAYGKASQSVDANINVNDLTAEQRQSKLAELLAVAAGRAASDALQASAGGAGAIPATGAGGNTADTRTVH